MVDLLKDPLFTPTNVSEYLGIPRSTVYRWLRPGTGEPLVHRVPAPRRSPSVPFAALVEAYVLRALKNELGFTHHQIVATVADVRATFGTDYALATKRIATDGVDIFLRHADGRHARVGDHQTPIEEFVAEYLRYLQFPADMDGIATRLQLPRYPNDAAVIVDPRFGWGDPVMRDSKVPVHQVLDLWRSGESIAAVAHEYDLEPSQVEAVCRVGLSGAA